ncbi:MAG: PD-(D/E)XK nuclease family protein [Clostridia bacterium]
MQAKFICGKAGSGKTKLIYEQIKNKLNPNLVPNLFLITPEQASFQIEQEVLTYFEIEGNMQLEIYGFRRLVRRILEMQTFEQKIPLDSNGKLMLLRKVWQESQDKLILFKGKYFNSGFLQDLAAVISELKQQLIKPESLQKLAESLDNDVNCKQKMLEVAILYNSFECELNKGFFDEETLWQSAIQVIKEKNIFAGAFVWIDGFSYFNALELLLLEEIALQADEITFSFIVDVNEPRHELYELPRNAMNGVREHLEKLKIPLKFLAIGKPEKENDPLAYLQKNFYNYKAKELDQISNNYSTVLWECLSPQEEVDFTAQEILRLVQEDDYHFRDIVVLVSEELGHASIINKYFPSYGIPFFINEQSHISNHPLLNTLVSAVKCVCLFYPQDAVLGYLKFGFSGLSIEEAELLENAVLEFGLFGKHWKKELNELEIETLHGIVSNILEEFARDLKGATTYGNYVEAIRDFLRRTAMQEKLEQEIERLYLLGEVELARISSQVWNKLEEILTELEMLLGDQLTDSMNFLQILQEGMKNITLGQIPTTIDHVLVGTVNNMQAINCKKLFFLGLVDGVFPNNSKDSGFFSEEEIMLLTKSGIQLPRNSAWYSKNEMLNWQSWLVRIQNAIIFSRPIASSDGVSLRPSVTLTQLRMLLGKNLQEISLLKSEKRLSSPQTGLKSLAEKLYAYLQGEELGTFWQEVYNWYKHNLSEDVACLEDGLFHNNKLTKLSPKISKNLYGKLHGSVSSLEIYAKCPFRYFVQYGLRPKERKIYEISLPQVGSLMHDVLAEYSKKLQQSNLRWQEIEVNEQEILLNELMENEIEKSSNNSILKESARYNYFTKHYVDIERRAISVLTDQLKLGVFSPRYFEIGFGENKEFPPLLLKLSNGEQLALEGRIDRIDIFQNNLTYIKLIDYKMGNRELDLSEVYYGRALQLLLYLNVALKLIEPRSVPAGIFYFRLDDPWLEENIKEEEVKNAMLKALSLQGWMLKDINVYKFFDKEASGIDFLPVNINKDGSFSKNSNVLEQEEFQLLLNYLEKIICKLTEQIGDGEISITPNNNGKENGCTFCTFQEICQFREGFGSDQYRNERHLNKEEALEKMAEELN